MPEAPSGEAQPTCMPCCGRGKVLALVAGEKRWLPCPWCGGQGVVGEEVDAQARWLNSAPPPDLSGPST